jgi:putative addiction module killer protein
LIKTSEFEHWQSKQQPKIQTLITARLDLLSVGHFGDHKRFEGLIELRWKNGTRFYTVMSSNAIVVALNGGNKNAHAKDVKKAVKIRNEILEGSRSVQK